MKKYFAIATFIFTFQFILCDDLQFSVTFKNKEEAAKVFSDESKYPYFELLEAIDIQAKIGQELPIQPLTEMRKKCKEVYAASTLDFDEKEKKAINDVLEIGKKVIGTKFKIFVRTPWKFIKVSNTIEGGLPHTRNDCIIFSETICSQLTKLEDLGDIPQSKFLKMKFLDLMIHEQVHVLQRLHKEKLDKFNSELLHFEHIKISLDHQWLKNNQIINPDAPFSDWAITLPNSDKTKTDIFLPFLVYKEKDGLRSMPYDFNKILLKLKKVDGQLQLVLNEDGSPNYIPMSESPEYLNRFSLTPTDNYHPNEMAADIISKVITITCMQESLNDDAKQNTKFKEHFKTYIEWSQKELNE